jgi:hypothetical protein
MKTKVCGKCKKGMNILNFSKGVSKDGLHSWCKNCNKEYKKIYHINHREESLKESKFYRETHQKELTDYFKKYRSENRELLNLKSNIWYKKNKNLREIYYQQHKQTLIKNQNEYFINRRKIDINFKIKCNLRIRIWKVLKGIDKSQSTIKLLGCSIDFLKQHLENQFTKGMSFSNYGKWHVDHIKPCASFDLSKSEEQKICFNYTNLQPLWALDNIRKSNKISGGK